MLVSLPLLACDPIGSEAMDPDAVDPEGMDPESVSVEVFGASAAEWQGGTGFTSSQVVSFGSSVTIPPTPSLTQNFAVENGFGPPILPHRIAKPDSNGNPTNQVVEIRNLYQLVNNKPSLVNPILPVAQWPAAAILPNQQPGNHYVLIRFGSKFIPNVKSILDPSSPTGLTGTVTVTALDPVSGVQTDVPGHFFVNGITINAGTYERWVSKGGPTGIRVNPGPSNPYNKKSPPLTSTQQTQIAAGYPGIASSFQGSKNLIGPRSIVFVVDSDNDLSTFETFPTGKNIRIFVSKGLRSTKGAFWPIEAVGVSTVGPDTLTPEVSVFPGPLTPVIDPALGASNVPTDKKIRISFTEPIQPFSGGPLPSTLPPPVTGGIRLFFQVGANTVDVPFTLLPVNAYNFAAVELTPAFQFPGSYYQNGPNGLPDANDVTFTVNVNMTTLGAIRDLSGLPNTIPRSSSFTTGEGAGIVNAPVAPGVIYVGFGGQRPGLGVLDLDGFGQGTGTPKQDDPNTLFIEPLTTNFPNNPDIAQPLQPPLTIENTPLAGGSFGPLTMTRDTSTVNMVFAQPPILQGVRDIHIGGPLDVLFNGGICISGTGNQCAKDAYHATNGNTIQVSPAPNPPKLTFPPPCLAPFIWGQEPVSASNVGASLLKPGNWLGNKSVGVPPQGVFTDNLTPYGPTWGSQGPFPPPVTQPATCGTYGIRQQVGHMLFVIDPVVRRVVVLNSNRMTVLTSIPQPDPTDLAMSADFKVLAVSNFATNQVQFINTDPISQDFLKVIQVTPVGSGPIGISADQDGEDYLVANSLSNNVSIINAQSRKVRKTVSNQLAFPFQIAVTPRQLNFGFNTGVYFAYIMNKFGTVGIYESGPAGVQGFGFDDIIGAVKTTFPFATNMQPDINSLNSGVWILHLNSNKQPVVSNLALTESPIGPLPLVQFFFFPVPSFRQREWSVVQQILPDQISGFAPRDIAFDNTNNIGAAAVNSLISPGSAGPLVPHSSKRQVRPIPGGFTNVSTPKAIFLANFDTGTIDVIGTASLLQLIPAVSAPGVQVLSDYWRQ